MAEVRVVSISSSLLLVVVKLGALPATIEALLMVAVRVTFTVGCEIVRLLGSFRTGLRRAGVVCYHVSVVLCFLGLVRQDFIGSGNALKVLILILLFAFVLHSIWVVFFSKFVVLLLDLVLGCRVLHA